MIKPMIVISVYKCEKTVLDELLAGIEEEGVLYEVRESQVRQEAMVLAREAAEISQLEVGIGVREDRAYLTISKLAGKPLLQTQTSYRELGQNAARYVKGNSFTQMIGGEL